MRKFKTCRLCTVAAVLSLLAVAAIPATASNRIKRIRVAPQFRRLLSVVRGRDAHIAIFPFKARNGEHRSWLGIFHTVLLGLYGVSA